jgi:hypothetical protein
MASSIGIINPEMTAEVSVQTSNFGAYVQNGPVVVSAISKSGTDHYHGEGYFDARNDILNANGWQQNHQGVPKAGAHYYYPGGNIGGPVPFTHKKVFIWGGYERFLQNPGNGNILESYIPSPEMLKGDFSTDNADNNVLCPNGFSATAQGNWCNNLAGTVLPDGTAITPGPGNTGSIIPSQYIDPGAAALASFWPKANANPNTTAGGYNYYEPVVSTNNGWVYRLRMDYNLNDNNKFYVSYQQAYSSTLARATALIFTGHPVTRFLLLAAASSDRSSPSRSPVTSFTPSTPPPPTSSSQPGALAASPSDRQTRRPRIRARWATPMALSSTLRC